jgi:hypothetical protein
MTIETELPAVALELTEWERTQLLQFSEPGADFRPYSEAERKRWKDLADKLRGATLKDDPGNEGEAKDDSGDPCFSNIAGMKADRDRQLGDEITELRARCEKAEAERDNADSAATFATAQAIAAESRCAELVKALEEAERALKPLADAVFNDNGDMTVSLPSPTSEECIAAYFAEKHARAALSQYRKGTT